MVRRVVGNYFPSYRLIEFVVDERNEMRKPKLILS